MVFFYTITVWSVQRISNTITVVILTAIIIPVVAHVTGVCITIIRIGHLNRGTPFAPGVIGVDVAHSVVIVDEVIQIYNVVRTTHIIETYPVSHVGDRVPPHDASGTAISKPDSFIAPVNEVIFNDRSFYIF